MEAHHPSPFQGNHCVPAKVRVSDHPTVKFNLIPVQGVQDFRKHLAEHREWDTKLKNLPPGIIGGLKKILPEDDMKAPQQFVGPIVGEVLEQLDEEKFVVKASSGPRYVVWCRNKADKEKLKRGAQVGKPPPITPCPIVLSCHSFSARLMLIRG